MADTKVLKDVMFEGLKHHHQQQQQQHASGEAVVVPRGGRLAKAMDPEELYGMLQQQYSQVK